MEYEDYIRDGYTTLNQPEEDTDNHDVEEVERKMCKKEQDESR